MGAKNKRYDACLLHREGKEEKNIAYRLERLLNRHRLHICILPAQRPAPAEMGEIVSAMKDSLFLILLCSPAGDPSGWYEEALQLYRSVRGPGGILPLLLEGEPDEVFPETIRWEKRPVTKEDGTQQEVLVEVEPLGADIRAASGFGRRRLLRREALRIAAPLLGCGFDDLYRRAERSRRKKLAVVLSAVLAGGLVFAGYSLFLLGQIRHRQQEMYRNESLRLAQASGEQLEEGDYRLAMLLAMAALPGEESPDRPLEEEARRALSDAVTALQEAKRSSPAVLQAKVPLSVELWQLTGLYADGTKAAVQDLESTSLYDTKTGKRIFSLPELTVYFDGDASRAACTCYESDGPGGWNAVVKLYRTDGETLYYTGVYPFLQEEGTRQVYGVFDEETGECRIVMETAGHDGQPREFALLETVDAAGNPVEENTLPGQVERLCSRGYSTSYLNGGLLQGETDRLAVTQEEFPEEYTLTQQAREALAKEGYAVSNAYLTESLSLLELGVMAEEGMEWHGHEESFFTVLLDAKEGKMLGILPGSCLCSRDGRLFMETYGALEIWEFFPGKGDGKQETEEPVLSHDTELSVLMEAAKHYLTSENGVRELTQEEKERFFLP